MRKPNLGFILRNFSFEPNFAIFEGKSQQCLG